MKVCVYGCGAIGGLLAARLVRSGASVSVLARGEHLAAIQTNGLTLLEGDQRFVAEVAASDTPDALGVQDIVILAMKGHSIAAAAPDIPLLLGAKTIVVTAANGIPWWYFHGLAHDFGAPELKSVDPGRQLWNSIGPERAIGCVVYPAARVEAPGVVRHMFGDRFAIGEPDGRISGQLETFAALLVAGGFDATVQTDIRIDIWTKLVANAAFNPVSVMTGKTLGAMIEDQATARLLEQIMQEVAAVADALGVTVAMTPTQLFEATSQLGDHKTSMLHDYEAGRMLELEPIVGAVLELAAVRGVAVPTLRMAYQLVAEKTGS
jgi:2-dehydropantoate 2-reductase